MHRSEIGKALHVASVPRVDLVRPANQVVDGTLRVAAVGRVLRREKSRPPP
ncbi:MAG TPA: hypothetical protein VND64_18545 [Pirellulales bacterium]|nr:hypothetical protein [Pirellulales bacterium]